MFVSRVSVTVNQETGFIRRAMQHRYRSLRVLRFMVALYSSALCAIQYISPSFSSTTNRDKTSAFPIPLTYTTTLMHSERVSISGNRRCSFGMSKYRTAARRHVTQVLYAIYLPKNYCGQPALCSSILPLYISPETFSMAHR